MPCFQQLNCADCGLYVIAYTDHLLNRLMIHTDDWMNLSSVHINASEYRTSIGKLIESLK
jgi:Ulp1 family protease